jgi:hypothetical protein
MFLLLSILGLKNTRFYKDEFFIPKSQEKENKKIKYLVLFTHVFLAPCTHTTCKYSLT